MTKFVYLLLISFLVIGCSSSDSSNNTNIDVLVGPTNLVGSIVSNTQINLSWDDNSTNESGFKIERKTTTSAYEVIGSTNSNILQFSDTTVIENITYSYRVYSYSASGIYSPESNVLTLTAVIGATPTLITTPISSVTNGTAFSGGTILNAGTSPVLARGMVWSTTTNPTIALATKTIDGSGTDPFVSYILGLEYNTTYYARAYATNSFGTSYGNDVSFTTAATIPPINIPGPNVTDVENNVTQSVINCAQIWTTKNLDVSSYDDGTPIPQVTDPVQWANLTTGAWCYYNNDPQNGSTYGKLYNWYAVAGIYDYASFLNPTLRKKLVPAGWHIATNTEWNSFASCLGGSSVAGGRLKATGTEYWQTPNSSATNLSGFSGLPGGFRTLDGLYTNIGTSACWLTSSPLAGELAYFRSVDYFGDTLTNNNYIRTHGFSVRCIRD